MNREQYRQMREFEVEKQKAEADRKRNDPSVSQKERNLGESQYQALLKQQEDWAHVGFWTENEETAYKLNCEQYQTVKGSYKHSSV